MTIKEFSYPKPDKPEPKELTEARKEKFDFKFMNELERLTAKERSKTQELKELENVFIDASNRVHDLIFDIRKGFLKKTPIEELEKMRAALTSSSEYLYNLAQEYFGFEESNGNINYPPDYDKYDSYSTLILNAIEKEIALREKRLNEGMRGE